MEAHLTTTTYDSSACEDTRRCHMCKKLQPKINFFSQRKRGYGLTCIQCRFRYKKPKFMTNTILDSLTPCQREALAMIRASISISKPLTQICGPGGVGKSYLIDIICSEYPNTRIICPTHKACSVVRDNLSSGNKHYESNQNGDIIRAERCMTVHRFLSGTLKYTDDGEEEWSFSPTFDPKDGNIVILDETSLVDEKMHKCLMSYCTQGMILITFGDPCQLPPVDKQSVKENTPFYEDPSLIDLEMTTQVRNKNESYARMLQWLRDLIRSKKQVTLKTLVEKLQQLLSVDFVLGEVGAYREEDKQLIQGLEQFKHSNIHDSMVAFRTSDKKPTVTMANNAIRDKLYGSNAEPYKVGERLVFSGYHCVKDRYGTDVRKFYTNDRIRVMKVSEVQMCYGRRNFGCYKLDCLNGLELTEEMNGEFETFPIYRIKQSEMEAFKEEVNHSRELIKRTILRKGLPAGSVVDTTTLWKHFYEELRSVQAPVEYAYCTSIHKSQGSTFDYIYVYLSDFHWMLQPKYNPVYFYKLLYVALSRARVGCWVF